MRDHTNVREAPPRQWVALVAALVIVYAAAAVGALGSADAGRFYAQLALPSWAPPGWIFGPVWSALYALMGIAAWLVWRARPAAGIGKALALFGAQLAANCLWSWLFFHWHRGAAAFVEVLILWALILATIVAFRRISPVASILMLPYLAWVTFAAGLNLAIWRLNPALL
jgi:benzodiazapine receptor